jgi:glycosyltransferase involved in cell wall biosynthesis
LKEPASVLQLVDPFRLAHAPVVPEGYRASLETRCEVLPVAVALEREGARLVHAVGARANVVAVAAARLVRARVVCGLAGPARTMPEMLACRAADAVVAPCEELKFGARVYVVYPSVDPARFRAAPSTEPVIAVIGALRPGNGHVDLIEAVAMLRPSVPGLRVLCAGEGPMRPVLEQRLRFHGLRETVHLLGYREDVPEILAGASVACLPRHDARPSRALVECMAASLPAVTSCAELADPQLLVPPRSPELLCDRLLGLLQDPTRARTLGAAARRRAERELSVDAARVRLAQVYKAALTVRSDRATSPLRSAAPSAAAARETGH